MFKSYILTASLLIGICISGNSQTNEETEAKEFIKGLYTSMFELSKTKNVDGFLSNFYNKVRIRLVSFNTENIINSEEIGFALLKHYAEILSNSEVTNKLNLVVFNDVSVRNDLVFINYKIVVETYEGDNLIRKGTRNNNALLKKENGKYKMLGMFSVQLLDEEYKGTCYCELDIGKSIVSTTNKEIRVTTFMPAGFHRDAHDDLITIDEGLSPRKVEAGSKSYTWFESGIVEFQNPDGSAGRRVGNAKDIKQLVSILISKELYPANCLTVKRKL